LCGRGEEDEGARADGVEQDALVAGGADVDEGEVGGEDTGEPAEGTGRVMAIGGVEGEGVVGAAVGAGGARAGMKHGSRLCA